MLDRILTLKRLLLRSSVVRVDNVVFRLHYRITTTVLFAGSLLVTCKQYIGDPIECTLPTTKVREEVLDQYCWVSSTLSLPKAFRQPVGGMYPGVDRRLPEDEFVRHQYYQWVCFVLFLQAVTFYLPHFLWKSWEGGQMRILSIMGNESYSDHMASVTSYFHQSLRRHACYSARYALCEVLNFFNVLAQIFITDIFLGGNFLWYGVRVMTYDGSETDPMTRAFPRVAKCEFHTFGATGEVQLHDAICVLPVNIINEKIYLLLWFWFVLLVALSLAAVVYRLSLVCCGRLRCRVLRLRADCVPVAVLDELNRRLRYSDWFLLYQLTKNVHGLMLRDVVDILAKQLRQRHDTQEGRELV